MREESFPIQKNKIYLDHAAGGVISLPVSKAIEKHQRELLNDGDFVWPEWIERREKARCSIARFINADPEEITFVNSTSQGMNWIAEMLSPMGGVLTNDLEFPSSTLPWIWRRSKITWQKSQKYGVPLDVLKKLLKPSIKTIVSSFVQYATGFRQDMERLGEIKGGRFLVVNATQGFGAFPIDVKKWDCDFLVTNSYKWLMAGYGGGVLYIRKKWLKKFKPLSVGWRSMKDPDRMDNRLLDLRDDAGRYEFGCPNFGPIFSVGASVDHLSKIGKQNISNAILKLTDYLIEKLGELGFEIVSPREKINRSGIVVFKTNHPRQVWKKCLGRNIFVSARGEGIRVAPHFYNTNEEINRFVSNLLEYRQT